MEFSNKNAMIDVFYHINCQRLEKVVEIRDSGAKLKFDADQYIVNKAYRMLDFFMRIKKD